MANIKVSELTEATTFENDDYTMIVQANQSKKITKENLLNDVNNNISNIENDILDINTTIGDTEELKTVDKTDVVNSINSIMPTILWTNPNPNSAISSIQEIELANDSYDVLEVFYMQITGTSTSGLIYSARFLKGFSTRMRIHTPDSPNIYRGLSYLTDTSYRIELPYSSVTLQNLNSLIIPLYIIGYNTGLFNNNEGE